MVTDRGSREQTRHGRKSGRVKPCFVTSRKRIELRLQRFFGRGVRQIKRELGIHLDVFGGLNVGGVHATSERAEACLAISEANAERPGRLDGGAFAIAKLLAGEPGKDPVVLGHLTLPQLAIGMALFTVVMVADILMFGEKMRSSELPGAFGWQGKLVLFLLGFLLCAGWLLAGFRV